MKEEKEEKSKIKSIINDILLLMFYAFCIGCIIVGGFSYWDNRNTFYLFDKEVNLIINSDYEIKTFGTINKSNDEFIYTSENENIAQVTEDGKVTAVSEGMTYISIKSKVSKNQNKLKVYVQGDKINTIKFKNNNIELYNNDTYKLKPIINNEETFKSDLVWKSENNKIVTVDQNGEIKAQKEGTTYVTCLVKDTNIEAKARITVKKKKSENNNVLANNDESLNKYKNVESVKIKSSKDKILVGETIKLNYEITPSNATYKEVKWESNNDNVVKVDSNGNITGIKSGKADILIETKEGNKKSFITITVVDKPIDVTSIKLSKNETTLLLGNEEALNISIEPSNATNQNITWTSSNTNIVSVDKNGKIKANGVGSTNITAKSNNEKTASIKVTVKEIEVNQVKLNKTQTTILLGNEETLYATIEPNNATNKNLTWTSSNTNVIVVDKSGKVKSVGEGKANIIAKTNNGKTAECVVSVNKKNIEVEQIKLSQNDAKIQIGQSITLKGSVEPSNATNQNITWTSSNPKVATVDNSGKVVALSSGTTIITATSNNGKKSTCNITVQGIEVEKITINNTKLNLNKGQTYNLLLTFIPSNATNKKVTWNSSNPKVASVDENGKVSALSGGNTTISAKSSNGITVNSVVTVNVLISNLNSNTKGIQLIKGSEYDLNKITTITPTDATNKVLTWTSSNNSIVTVNNGKIKGIKEGSATITAVTTDGSKKEIKYTIEVNDGKITKISSKLSNIQLKEGDSYQIDYTINPANAANKVLTWTSSNTKVATVDKNGKITAKARGTTTIEALANDGSGKNLKIAVTVKTKDIYDVVLFWGQSNMVGYAGLYKTGYTNAKNNIKCGDAEDKKDFRIDEIGGVNNFSKYSKIDINIVNKYTNYGHVDVPIPANTVYDYIYCLNGSCGNINKFISGNERLVSVTKDTKILGQYLNTSDGKTFNQGKSSKGAYSIQESVGTNLMPWFSYQHYKNTGHKVVIVSAANGGEALNHFLPHNNNCKDNIKCTTDSQYIYEAMKTKYSSAIKYLEKNNYTIGNKFHIVYQGESDVTDAYQNNKTNWDKIYNNIFNKSQSKAINDNPNVILGSSYPYDRYLPNEKAYLKYKTKYDAIFGSKDYKTALKYAELSLTISKCDSNYNSKGVDNKIHLNSAALSQVGLETANNVNNYLKNKK